MSICMARLAGSTNPCLSTIQMDSEVGTLWGFGQKHAGLWILISEGFMKSIIECHFKAAEYDNVSGKSFTINVNYLEISF